MKLKKIVFLIFFIFLITPLNLYGNTKSLLWIGFGEAEAKYEEDYYKIDKEIKGSTWEYAEFAYNAYKNHRSIIKNSTGWSKSFFLHYTLFDPKITDSENREHELSFTEIIPYWSRGYTYTIHATDKLNILNFAELFLGLGLITFEKEVVGSYNFSHKFGFDIGYGYSLNTFINWDDRWFFGWRSLVKSNRIKLEFSNENGYLTHRRDIMFIIGGTFGGSNPNCVPTAYTPCP